jgi:mycofactocin precursor
MTGAPRKESAMDDVRDQDAVTETEETLEVDDLLVEEVSIDGMCGVY